MMAFCLCEKTTLIDFIKKMSAFVVFSYQLKIFINRHEYY